MAWLARASRIHSRVHTVCAVLFTWEHWWCSSEAATRILSPVVVGMEGKYGFRSRRFTHRHHSYLQLELHRRSWQSWFAVGGWIYIGTYLPTKWQVQCNGMQCRWLLEGSDGELIIYTLMTSTTLLLPLLVPASSLKLRQNSRQASCCAVPTEQTDANQSSSLCT